MSGRGKGQHPPWFREIERLHLVLSSRVAFYCLSEKTHAHLSGSGRGLLLCVLEGLLYGASGHGGCPFIVS